MVVELFGRVVEFDTRFNEFTLSIVLKCCVGLGDLRQGQAVHSLVVKVGLEMNGFFGSTLVDMYSKCGLADDAWRVFDDIKEPNVVVWSVMFLCFAHQGFSREAIELFETMRRKGLEPNQYILSNVASVASQLGDRRFCGSVHAYIVKSGYEMGNAVGNAVLKMYMNVGAVRDGCLVFDYMVDRDTSSWNTLLSGFHGGSNCVDGLRIFSQMLSEDYKPNNYTFSSVLRLCSSLMELSFGVQVHAHILKDNFHSDPFVGKALVDMYANCGCFDDACVVFNMLTERDVFTWTVIIAEYLRDGGSDPRKLLYELDKVKTKLEDLARTAGHSPESAGSTGSNSIPESRGNSTALRLSTANSSSAAYRDVFDSSAATFNIAVILYHLHEYKRALSVILPLYQNLELMDEPIALHICLLLLDVALASQEPSIAADVIQYLEKKSSGGGYAINTSDNGSISRLQSLKQGLKISAATSITSAQENSSSDSCVSASVSENPLVGTSSDDALEFENLYSTLDGGGQNLDRPVSNDISKTSVDWVAPAFDLNLKLHLYKVRLLLLTKNQKATKREVKLAMNDVRGRDSSTERILKSQVEYGRYNYNKAIKLLQASSNRTEPAMQIIFDNNLGCIYHQLGKYNMSQFLFTRALKTSYEQISEKPRKLSTFSQSRLHQIFYNCGLESLICGNPVTAAHAFHQAAPLFDNRPLFWLRSAECCLLVLTKQPLGSGEEIKVHVVGSGKGRQLVVDDSNLRNKYRASAASDKRLTLPFARECLYKALVLLGHSEAKNSKFGTSVLTLEDNVKNVNNSASEDSKEAKSSQGANTTLQNSVAAYEEMCIKENHKIKQAVLLDLVYVELCLEDPLRALHAARSLQKLSECSRMYNFLSRVYAAEALCQLNRLQEAAEELSVYLKDENGIELPYNEEDMEKWSTVRPGDGEGSKAVKTDGSLDWALHKPDEARGALYTNFAAMFAMQGDIEQAGRFANKALNCLPNNPRATLAAVYVNLKQGRGHDALVKLKERRHVRFLATPAR